MFLLGLIGILLMAVVCMFAAWATEEMDRRNGIGADGDGDLFDWRMKGIDL